MSYSWRTDRVPAWTAAGLVLLSLAVTPAVSRAQSIVPPIQAVPAPQPAVAPAVVVVPPTVSPAPADNPSIGDSIRVRSTTTAAPAIAAPAKGVPVAPLPAASVPMAAAPANSSIGAAPDSAARGNSATTVASTGPSTGKSVLNGLGGGGMAAVAQKLSPAMMRALKQFEIAKAAFPGFCADWQRKLKARESDNAAHINWRVQNGTETGTYVGYSPIDSCVCKQASNGIAIGELTYKELDYTLTGKSVDDARHAKPQVNAVPTREIFSWDKGKWFY